MSKRRRPHQEFDRRNGTYNKLVHAVDVSLGKDVSKKSAATNSSRESDKKIFLEISDAEIELIEIHFAELLDEILGRR